jgi:hypothetical protein
MGNLFSAISSQFSKSIIVGAFFPALLFLLFAYLFVLPMLPWEIHVLTRLVDLDAQWKLAVFTIVAILTTIVLYVLNNAIIRLYEGYPWCSGPLGTYLTGRQRRKLEQELALLPDLHRVRVALWDTVAAKRKRIENDASLTAAQRNAELKALDSREGTLAERLENGQRLIIERHLNEYPRAASVLPTKLGNVIRSFENYSYRQYAISAIPLWPRFVSKIEPGYATAIEDAKSQFDFALNASFLFTILFVSVLLLGIGFPVPFVSEMLFAQWVLKLLVTGVAAALLYEASLSRAMEWGVLVRSAFDLFRRPVLQALGFTDTPQTLEEERDLWSEISRQYGYGDPVGAERSSLRFSLPSLAVEPPDAGLRISRGVGAVNDGRQTIHTRVRNPGDAPIEAELTEKVSGQLLWGSVKVNDAVVTAEGTNPYVFSLGTIAPNAHVDLEYQVIRSLD